MRAKLRPFNDAKISFPGFQRILDFTATGSESTKSITVDGDTDKEYKILVRNVSSSPDVIIRLNADSGSNYGRQYLDNSSGSITASRGTRTGINAFYNGLGTINLLTPTGFVKTFFDQELIYVSGTTISNCDITGYVWNNTANVTSIDFGMSSGNFAAGTRIIVYARRSQ